MARFRGIYPDETLKQLEKIDRDADKIFGAMTKAGAEVALSNAKAGVPVPEMASHVKLSRTYKTPSDGGINTKVYISGYLPFKGNRKTFSRRGGNGSVYVTDKGIPAAFIAIMFEYGRSGKSFPKRPWFRKSFNRAQIEAAMLKAQARESGGVLK